MAEKSLKPTQIHPDRDKLAAFLYGQLEEADQEAITGHLESCDACCDVLREIPDDPLLARLRDANVPASSPGEEPKDGDDNAPAEPTPPHLQPLPAELSDHPRYRIGRFLGAGGMGLVYQAEHKLMDRVVAIKVIHRDLMRHPRVIERFRQEVKAAGRLVHPNIVTAYDAEQAGDVHFLVMEFVDGFSLGKLVARRGPLEIATACNFIRQAARGLQHAFEAGMVHRDIKPQNLMLTRKGQIKILDFGLARLASETREELGLPAQDERSDRTRMGEIMGTPAYMAPEQIVNPSEADIRADLYSLSCTLYYLLTGRLPFREDYSVKRVMFAQQYKPPDPIAEIRRDVPAELANVIHKMLARDPADRYQTPADVVKALTLPVKPSAPERPVKPKPAVVQPDEAPKRGSFLAQCPFCQTRSRIPEKVLGASLPCPQCGSYFTAVPIEQKRKS